MTTLETIIAELQRQRDANPNVLQVLDDAEPQSATIDGEVDLVELAAAVARTKLTLHEIHNASAGEIVRQIIRPTIAAGGRPSDAMALLESIVVGVMIVCVRLGYDERAIELLVANVKARMAEQRLGPISPAGSS